MITFIVVILLIGLGIMVCANTEDKPNRHWPWWF